MTSAKIPTTVTRQCEWEMPSRQARRVSRRQSKRNRQSTATPGGILRKPHRAPQAINTVRITKGLAESREHLDQRIEATFSAEPPVGACRPGRSPSDPPAEVVIRSGTIEVEILANLRLAIRSPCRSCGTNGYCKDTGRIRTTETVWSRRRLLRSRPCSTTTARNKPSERS